MDTLRARAQLAIATMPNDTAKLYTDAWSHVVSFIHNRIPKHALNFEVHHSIEAARKRFFVALLDGKSAHECEMTAKT